MKKIIILTISLFLVFKISAQVIYVSTISNQLYRLDVDNCTSDFVVNIQAQSYDIAYHPNGNMYGVSGDGNLYEIDTLSGATNVIHNFSGVDVNSLVVAENGLVYAASFWGELWSYDILSDSEIYLGIINSLIGGDLIFRNGDLYAAINNDQISLIDISNPSNSSTVINESLPGELYGLASLFNGCTDTSYYAMSSLNSRVYEIDFITNSLNFICQLNIEISGGTSIPSPTSSPPIVIQDINESHPNCNSNDGSILVNATGGTGQITYSIDGINFQTSGLFENLPPGIYTITISDDSNCNISSEVELLASNNLSGDSILSPNSATCGNANGSIIVSTNSTGLLEYSIDGINFQASSIFTNLLPGNYTITIQDDNGCFDIESIEVLSEDLPEIISISSNSTTCGNVNGSMTISASGGTGQLEYSIDGINFQTSNTFDNLSSGNYTLTIQDDDGCSDTENEEVLSEDAPEIITISSNNTTCGNTNGSITVSTNGGTGQLEYSIDGTNFQSSNIFNNLPVDNYIITVQDDNGCSDTGNIAILSEDIPQITSVSSNNSTCGNANGSITASASGGTGQLEYSIDGINFQTSNIFDNLPADNYTITIQDGNGCSDTENTVILSEDAPQIVNVSSNNTTCGNINGSITISPSGGTGQLEYSIDGINFQASNIFDNLPANNYTITIQDDNGCSDTENTAILSEDAPQIVSVSSNNTTCGNTNGSITISASGGTGQLEYSIDGINFQASNIFDNLSPNNYTITIQDDNGCSDTGNEEILSEDVPEIINIILNNTTCGDPNGFITVSASGFGQLEYSMNGTDYQQDNVFSDLAFGDYTIFMKDENDCIVTSDIEIANSSELLIGNIESITAICGESNGGFSIEMESGTGLIELSLDGGIFQSDFSFDNLAAGEYFVRIMDETQCRIDTLLSVDQGECPIYIPNVFSPNNDGINDLFKIYPHPEFDGEFRHFRIFDRWGALVFEFHDFNPENVAWDGTYRGKDLGIGVYVYFITYTSKGKSNLLKGDVTIIR